VIQLVFVRRSKLNSSSGGLSTSLEKAFDALKQELDGATRVEISEKPYKVGDIGEPTGGEEYALTGGEYDGGVMVLNSVGDQLDVNVYAKDSGKVPPISGLLFVATADVYDEDDYDNDEDPSKTSATVLCFMGGDTSLEEDHTVTILEFVSRGFSLK
jgi:hypothetical protein